MDRMAETRELLQRLLSLRGDRRPFTDTSSFFLSGRLGSVDAVELVVFLAEKFGIAFAAIGFDESQIDSIEAIQSLVETAKGSK